VEGQRDKLDLFQEIWEWAIENLTTEDVKYNLLLDTDKFGRTAWHVAGEHGKLDVLMKIREWAKDNLTTQEIKNNLLLSADRDGKSV
jgi:endo-1,4-beta-D-glucanase Y